MRIFDLNKLEDGVSIEADLCIVGSRLTDMSIAAEFAKTNFNVLALESGGIDDDAPTLGRIGQAINAVFFNSNKPESLYCYAP
jgi:choline dehydrogenase-like flavoprotein